MLTHNCLLFGPAMHKNIAVGALIESHKTDSFQFISSNRFFSSIDGHFLEVFLFCFPFQTASIFHGCILSQKIFLFNQCKILQNLELCSLPIAKSSNCIVQFTQNTEGIFVFSRYHVSFSKKACEKYAFSVFTRKPLKKIGFFRRKK